MVVTLGSPPSRHHEIPALVADIDAECGALATERTVAQIADARRDQRTAIRTDRLAVRHRPRRHSRDDPSDSRPTISLLLATPLRRSAAVLRHQQQSRRLDRVAGDDVDLGFDRVPCRSRSSGPCIVVYLMYLIWLTAPFVADDDLAGDRPVTTSRSRCSSRRSGDGRIVFRLDRADRNAVGVAGAGAAVSVWLANCARPARL